MRKAAVVSFGIMIFAFAAASAAQAGANPLDQGYTRPTGASYVAIIGCFSNGGSARVPANAPFTAFAGWAAETIGQVNDFLHGSTNTLSIDLGAPIDMSPYFRGLTHEWTGDDEWADIFFYQLPALAPGHSVELAYSSTAVHPIADGETGFPGPPAPAGGFTYTCTVTGV